MKILFVCSRTRIRSQTAKHHRAGRPGLAVRSAGTATSARVRVTAGHIGWTDAEPLRDIVTLARGEACR